MLLSFCSRYVRIFRQGRAKSELRLLLVAHKANFDSLESEVPSVCDDGRVVEIQEK